MSTHLKDQARARYGVDLSDADVETITAQCRSGRGLLRTHERHPNGPSEHHLVTVRGARMCAVRVNGRVVTILPRDWLDHDDDTALAAAFRRAMSNSQVTHQGD